MTLLTIVQEMCDELALDKPLNVVGNADGITSQLLAAVNSAGRSMATMNDPAWGSLTRFGSFTTTSTSLQGDLSDIAPDFGFIVSDTLWNLSNAWPVEGSITPQQWTFLIARNGVAPYGTFRMLVDPATNKMGIYVTPAPGAGEPVTFEYISKMWVISPNQNPDNSLYTWDKFQTDNDTTFFNEEALKKQAMWRWRKTKGFDDWPVWKTDADTFTNTIRSQEHGTSSFYIGTFRGTRLLTLANVQDGNYPASST